MLINFKMLNIEPRRASAACAMTTESKTHIPAGDSTGNGGTNNLILAREAIKQQYLCFHGNLPMYMLV